MMTSPRLGQPTGITQPPPVCRECIGGFADLQVDFLLQNLHNVA